MALVFSCENSFSQCRTDKECRRSEFSLCLPYFLSGNRIAPEGVGTNKENIPSSKGSCWGCAEEEAGSSSSADWLGGDGERTPKPRKHSPTSVLLTNNQDGHAVSVFAALLIHL